MPPLALFRYWEQRVKKNSRQYFLCFYVFYLCPACSSIKFTFFLTRYPFPSQRIWWIVLFWKITVAQESYLTRNNALILDFNIWRRALVLLVCGSIHSWILAPFPPFENTWSFSKYLFYVRLQRLAPFPSLLSLIIPPYIGSPYWFAILAPLIGSQY